MSVEVSWSGLKKAAREGSWVFEVVPVKGEAFDESAFDAAVKSANEIHQADIDRFCDGNMEWRFPTPTGIGFWCEYEMTGPQVTDFIGVFVAELEKQNVTATIRAVRQSRPRNLYQNSNGLSLLMVLNGHRQVWKPGDLNYGWTAETADLEAVVEQLLDWCSFDEAKYWVQHAQNSMIVDATPRKDLVFNYVRPAQKRTEFVAETTEGQYRRVEIIPSGVVVMSLGSVEGNDWRTDLAELESLVRRLAPHIVYGGIAQTYTTSNDYGTFMSALWHHTKPHEERLLRVVPWKRERCAELVLGYQVLGPRFTTPHAQPGWQLETLDAGRKILQAENREAWFAQKVDRERLKEAFQLFPEITTLPDDDS